MYFSALAGVAEQGGRLRPGIRLGHIDDADGLDALPRRLSITINNIEVGRYAGDPESLAVIETVLTRAGVEFTNGNRPGVRLRKGRSKS